MKSFLLLTLVFALWQCGNNPYPKHEREAAIHYDSFNEEPKTLDPAKSYSSDQWQLISLIYEPILQYHFLKRPYELEPLTVVEIPQPKVTAQGVEYTIRLKKQIYYAAHPAFVKRKDGSYVWHSHPRKSFNKISHPLDLLREEETIAAQKEYEGGYLPFASRELTADDYIYQIKRLAHPQLHSPIAAVISKYILGFAELGQQLGKEVEAMRAKRKEQAGIFYNAQRNEKSDPLYIDLRQFDLKGVEKIDDYSYKIILKQPYPQMLYWLAMPFFSPMPWEVDRFFLQPASAEQNITIDRFPAGSGPYVLTKSQPNFRMELSQNPLYHDEFYPTEGEAGDLEAGYLKDSGKKIPFIEKVVFNYEKEALPQWIKFLQGYYDTSGVLEENFDRIMNFGKGDSNLSDEMQDKGLRLNTAVAPTVFYFAFNIDDPVFGGYSPARQKLRQAISIALNAEEFLQIFTNGRGKLAAGPIPEGIFGHQANLENKYVYDPTDDQVQGKLKPRSIDHAKKLLEEAGYKNGIDKSDNKQLVLYFDTAMDGPVAKSRFDLFRKQLARIGVDFQVRKTDYNQFQSKVHKGNYQFLFWGWHADYPDPENFLFLLYGPNGKKRFNGENVANYDNPQFNTLFRQMENMNNSPQRLAIIKQMMDILQQDAPWHFYFVPEAYGLYHSWYHNAKPMTIGSNGLKYKRIDFSQRLQKRNEWNSPALWPVIASVIILSLLTWFGVRQIRRRNQALPQIVKTTEGASS